MSSEEVPPVPARPERLTASPSPVPVVPARPNSKSPTPQVPTRRPNRVKTSDLDNSMPNTDNQLEEMQSSTLQKSNESRTKPNRLQEQEDNVQRGKEDLLGTNEMELELQEEKERLLKKKELELAERRMHQSNREEELKVLDKRKAELMLERKKEHEQEDFKKQKELELEDQNQKELKKRQELELEVKRKELEKLEKERQMTKENSRKLEEETSSEAELNENVNLDDQAPLVNADHDFNIKDEVQKKQEIPRIPERPKKSQSPQDIESKPDIGRPKIPERRPRAVGGRLTENPVGLKKGSDSSENQFSEPLSMPDKSSTALEKDVSGSPTNSKIEPNTVEKETLGELPSIPQKRPVRLKKEMSNGSPMSLERKLEPIEKKSNVSSFVPEKSFFSREKKLSNEYDHSGKDFEPTREESSAEGLVIPTERSDPVDGNSTVDSSVVSEKGPETLEKKSADDISTLSEKKLEDSTAEPFNNSTVILEKNSEPEKTNTSTDPLNTQPSFFSLESEKGLDVENKSESPFAQEREQNTNVKNQASKAPAIEENAHLFSPKTEIENLGSQESRTPPSDVSKQRSVESVESHVPSGQDHEELTMKDDSTKMLDVDVDKNKGESGLRDGEDRPEEPTKELIKKKAPPVPKKPSSRIVAFQEMLRKQQMEEMQGPHRKDSESVAEVSKHDSNETDSPEMSQQSVPQRPARQQISAEKSKFASSLNGLFALPGMSPMGRLPPSFAKKLEPASSTTNQEEKKDSQTTKHSVSEVRSSRARGPRGRKLPSNLASVEKVNSESKTNEIEIFETWKTVLQKENERTIPGRSSSFSKNSIDYSNEKTLEVTNPAHFDLDSDKAVRPFKEDEEAQDHGESILHDPRENTVLPKEDVGAIEQVPKESEKGKNTQAYEKSQESKTKSGEPLLPERSSGNLHENQPLIREIPSTSQFFTKIGSTEQSGSVSPESPDEHEEKKHKQLEQPLIPKRPLKSEDRQQPLGLERSSTITPHAIHDSTKQGEFMVLEKSGRQESKEQEHHEELIPERPLQKQEENNPSGLKRPSIEESSMGDELSLSERPAEYHGKEHKRTVESLIPREPTKLTEESEELSKSEFSRGNSEHKKDFDSPKNFSEFTEPIPETTFSFDGMEDSSKNDDDNIITVKDAGDS